MAIDVKKKVGPLPLYAWVGIGTVAVLALYLRMRANNTQPTTDTLTTPAAPTLDPTTGLPYTGIPSGGGNVTAPDTSGNFSTPTIASEVSDVLGLIGAFQGSGLLTQPGQDFTESQKETLAELFGQNANPSLASDHAAPTPVGSRRTVVTRPSAAHGGALYDYYKSADGHTLSIIGPSSKTRADSPGKGLAKKATTKKKTSTKKATKKTVPAKKSTTSTKAKKVVAPKATKPPTVTPKHIVRKPVYHR